MATYTIREEWFNEIKNEVPHANPYFYEEEGRTYVEVEILNEDFFISLSKKLGWM